MSQPLSNIPKFFRSVSNPELPWVLACPGTPNARTGGNNPNDIGPRIANNHTISRQTTNRVSSWARNGLEPKWLRSVVVVVDAILQAECLCRQVLSMKLCRSPRQRRTLRRRGLRKLALNSGITRRSAKNGLKNLPKPLHRRHDRHR